ncbi:MAG: GTP cyclohydrolase I FolE [Deltaproteobacteria bacterium]|nr:GTP cyclohydrolase I FolE [Deltaproteobacteria bacterium]
MGKGGDMPNSEKIASLVRQLLQELGEDPDREGLQKTPLRVAKSLQFLTKGYQEDPKEIIHAAKFTEKYSEIILVKDIALYTLCEHHLLPFWGHVHVGYIPRDKIIGLSKVARLVEVFARRLQVQERLTTQIAENLQRELKPLGVAVVIEAEHLCMQMRGVQKRGAKAVTSAMLGAFESKLATRQEFMHLIK